MEGDHKRMSVTQQAQLGTNFAFWFARLLVMLFSRDVGRRAAEDAAGTLGSFGIILAFALFGQSEPMFVVLLVAVVVQAVHRTRAGFVKGVSSWYMGTPVLGPNTHVAVGAAAFIGGIPLMQFDKAFGLWLMLAGAGSVITVQLLKARTQAIDQDMQDAAYEAYARQQRMQQFYDQMEE